jgi:RNA polymerase sigma factor (sigma-70 family)
MRLQSDERLAELAIDGHEAAFAAIVDRYRAPLLRYCAGIVGASRAEDAVQQVLINAHDALNRTSDVRHLRSWLYRIAHNASLNVLRAVRDDVPLDPSHAALADGPAAAFERAERLRSTLDAVRHLPERQRAALVLRELEGRSHKEIAEALGVTQGSARQHLMRARTAVRGAVTAITPYPLIAKLAEAATSPATGSWVDAAAGAGSGAVVVKLTAGVMATGALVGGAVGTNHVVHRSHRHTAPLATHTTQRSPTAAAAAPAIKNAELTLPATSKPSGSAGGSSDRHDRHGGTSSSRKGEDANRADDHGGSGDDHGRGARGAPSSRGSGDDHGGRGGAGAGLSGNGSSSGDEGDGRSSGGNGSEDRGTSGKGTSGKGTSGSANDTTRSDDRGRGKDDGGSGKGSDDVAVTEPLDPAEPSSGKGSGEDPAPITPEPSEPSGSADGSGSSGSSNVATTPDDSSGGSSGKRLSDD